MNRHQQRQALIILGVVAALVVAGLGAFLVFGSSDSEPTELGDIRQIAPQGETDRVLKVETEEKRRGLLYIDAGSGTLDDGSRWVWRAARPSEDNAIKLPDREIPLDRDPAGIGGTLRITGKTATSDATQLTERVREVVDDDALELAADARIQGAFSVKAKKIVATTARVQGRTLTLTGVFPQAACKDAGEGSPLAVACRVSRAQR